MLESVPTAKKATIKKAIDAIKRELSRPPTGDKDEAYRRRHNNKLLEKLQAKYDE